MSSEPRPRRRWTRALGVSLALALALSLSMCARRGPSGPRADASLDMVWPAPPEPPRVRLLQIVESPQDLIAGGGLWAGLQSIVAGEPTERLATPSALAVNESLGLVVADPGVPGVHIFDWVRDEYHLVQGDDEHPLVSPVGVAITPDGVICVSDSARGAIVLISADGEITGEITDPGRLLRPAGLAFDPESRELIVVDVLAHGLKRYTLGGVMTLSCGGQGIEPGQFNFPTHLFRMADGRLVVTDSLNFRLQVLSSTGQPLAMIGRLGDAPGCLARPKGVVADSEGNIWVVDAQFENIQVFDPVGQLLLHFGGAGQAPGQFWLPAGLAMDGENRLFVADTHNRRVQIFQCMPGPEVMP
ncbi:6-bladed beta-propeller [Candidatus Sumerlaeota bacterium]|nr:6-bladed beta-propeller [Candidatus Sumerlaeota bacterium]